MAIDFLPRRQTELRDWTKAFSAAISASPATYGLTAQQAADYAALNDAFLETLWTTSRNSTRTPTSIVAKKDAMKALKAKARELARIIRANPAVTASQRRSLGLSIHEADEASPRIAPPTQPPLVGVQSVRGRSVTIRLRDLDSRSKRRPRGVHGATIFCHVGDKPPGSIAQWQFAGQTTRTTCRIDFDPTVEPGARVWITAFWVNPRLQRGPASTPIDTRIEFSGAVSFGQHELRLAA